MKRFIGALFISAIALEFIHVIGWAQYFLATYADQNLATGEKSFYHPFLRIDIAGNGHNIVGILAIAVAGLACLLAVFHGLRSWLLATSTVSIALWATTYGLTNGLQMTALWALGLSALAGALVAPLGEHLRQTRFYHRQPAPTDTSALETEHEGLRVP